MKMKLFMIITQALSPEDYRYVMNVVESAILSTDLAMYFKKRDKFLELIDNGEFDWQSDEKKECKLICLALHKLFSLCDINFNLFCLFSLTIQPKIYCVVLSGMLMTACDVSKLKI